MDPAISPWKKIRYRLEWLGVFLLARTIPLLPRRMVLLVARPLGWLGYHFDRRGRIIALQNLAAVFGDEKSAAEIRAIAVRSYQSFARTMCDHFWTPRLNRENFSRYCHYDMPDPAILEAARKTGAIWVTPHYGNFEWLALCMGFLDFPFHIIAREFKNPLLENYFRRNREFTGHTVIPQRRSMIRLLKHLKKGGNAAFLCDLTVPPTKAATVINCLGLETCVPAMHGELARRTGLPVFSGISLPRDDGGYDVIALPLLEASADSSPREIAQKCWDAIEPYVRENPEHWIWMYTHWRFHRPGEGERYPAYSKPTHRFDLVLAAETARRKQGYSQDATSSDPS